MPAVVCPAGVPRHASTWASIGSTFFCADAMGAARTIRIKKLAVRVIIRPHPLIAANAQLRMLPVVGHKVSFEFRRIFRMVGSPMCISGDMFCGAPWSRGDADLEPDRRTCGLSGARCLTKRLQKELGDPD